MSQLNQIIASLLSDINEAKSKADESSKNLAQTYAADDILKYFPVPKIGISNLEVEIKYAIESVEEKPIQSSQLQQKLTAFIQNFSKDTAKEIRNTISQTVQANELFKGLGSSYPSITWEQNLAKSIEDGFLGITKSTSDLQKNIKGSFDSFGKVMFQFLPLLYKSESLAVVPKSAGDYQVIGLTKEGAIEFSVDKFYATESEALEDATTLNKAISTKKIEILDTRRESVSKVDFVKIKTGSQEFMLSVESQKLGSVQPKTFFERSFSEKSALLTAPVRIMPFWMSGRVPVRGNSSPRNPQSGIELREDDDLKVISENILKKRLTDLEFGISKILDENKITSMQVTVESEKLKLVKPENLATIKFSLSAQDFTMIDDESKKSIL